MAIKHDNVIFEHEVGVPCPFCDDAAAPAPQAEPTRTRDQILADLNHPALSSSECGRLAAELLASAAPAPQAEPTDDDIKVFWPYELIRNPYESTLIRLIADNCTPDQAADGLRAIADWLQVGAAPAETAGLTFREQLEKDWMAQQKWLDFTNYVVYRLEDVERPKWKRQASCPECDGDGCANCGTEAGETAGEMTPEQWQRHDHKKYLHHDCVTCKDSWNLAEVEAYAKQRVEDYSDAAAKLEKMREVLRRIIDDLPTRRDWLDPDIERLARRLLAE